MGVLMHDDAHEPILDIGVHPVGRAQRFGADLHARVTSADTDRLAPADRDRDGWKAHPGIEIPELAKRNNQPIAHAWQDTEAIPGFSVDLRPRGDGSGDRLPGHVA